MPPLNISEASRLLSLPTEVQAMILRELLVNKSQTISITKEKGVFTYQPYNTLHLDIIATQSIFREQELETLYSSNFFHISSRYLPEFSALIGVTSFSRIRNLRIDFMCGRATTNIELAAIEADMDTFTGLDSLGITTLCKKVVGPGARRANQLRKEEAENRLDQIAGRLKEIMFIRKGRELRYVKWYRVIKRDDTGQEGLLMFLKFQIRQGRKRGEQLKDTPTGRAFLE